ncbi:MAG: hypothetical protein ACE5E8_02875 [Acidimicrobiia bacterium]
MALLHNHRQGRTVRFPYKLWARIVNPLICRMIDKVIQTDVNGVNAYCTRCDE